jgi:hypothetical protein
LKSHNEDASSSLLLFFQFQFFSVFFNLCISFQLKCFFSFVQHRGRKRSPELREEGELRESGSEFTIEERKVYSRFSRFGDESVTLNPFKRSRTEHQ